MEYSLIKRVEIKGLWGVKNIAAEFDKHVNIFIGANGSSKTTFLNMLEATFLCDLYVFSSIEFESIEIKLDSGVTSVVRVDKYYVDDSPFVRYIFNNNLEYEILCSDTGVRSYRSIKYRETISMIKSELDKLVSVSWLSVNRDNQSGLEYDRSRDYVEKLRNMVDLKLQDLMKRFIVYQLQLQSEANKSANKFKEDTLSLMLYNEEIDSYRPSNIELFVSTDIDSMKRDLYRAFSALEVVKDKSDRIKTHVQKISDIISKIKKKSEINLSDVYILSLINRTLSIIEISKKNKEETEKIFEPIRRFWRCIKKFMPTKQFEMGTDNEGVLKVLVDGGKEEQVSIPVTSLSSGEKQLFILLTEVLLQRGMPYIFIADEPELSLHIEWQRLILKVLCELNENVQIIVATHSPEIASSFPNNVINMSNITTYVKD